MSIKAFYHDFSCQREQSQARLSYAECSRERRAMQFMNYMIENYSATPDQLMLDWNSVGACIHYFGKDCTIQFRLWERSEGHLGIPDMTLIIIRISFRGTQEVIRAEMTA